MFRRITTEVGIDAFAAQTTSGPPFRSGRSSIGFLLPGLMENPDLIPIYYFQRDVLGADAQMISGSLRGGYCPQRLANRH